MNNLNNNNQPDTKNAPDLEQELLKKRASEFEKEFVALQEKHGIIVIPQQQVTPFGTMLELVYMSKEEFDRRQKLAASGGAQG